MRSAAIKIQGPLRAFKLVLTHDINVDSLGKLLIVNIEDTGEGHVVSWCFWVGQRSLSTTKSCITYGDVRMILMLLIFQ